MKRYISLCLIAIIFFGCTGAAPTLTPKTDGPQRVNVTIEIPTATDEPTATATDTANKYATSNRANIYADTATELRFLLSDGMYTAPTAGFEL